MQKSLAKRHLLSSGTVLAQILPDAHQNLVSGHSQCCSLPVSCNTTDKLCSGLESWQQEASPAPLSFPPSCQTKSALDSQGEMWPVLLQDCQHMQDSKEPHALHQGCCWAFPALPFAKAVTLGQPIKQVISSPPFAQLHACTLWPHGVTAARAREARPEAEGLVWQGAWVGREAGVSPALSPLLSTLHFPRVAISPVAPRLPKCNSANVLCGKCVINTHLKEVWWPR